MIYITLFQRLQLLYLEYGCDDSKPRPQISGRRNCKSRIAIDSYMTWENKTKPADSHVPWKLSQEI